MSTTDYQMAVELANASSVVYQDNGSMAGYAVVAAINDADTGFYMQVFQKNGTQEYIFAFRGTEASMQDAYTDANFNKWGQSNVF